MDRRKIFEIYDRPIGDNCRKHAVHKKAKADAAKQKNNAASAKQVSETKKIKDALFAVRYGPELLDVARVIAVPVRENNHWVAKEADSDRVLAGGE